MSRGVHLVNKEIGSKNEEHVAVGIILAIELEKDLRKFDKETYKLHTEHKYFINHEESNKDAINYSTIV